MMEKVISISTVTPVYNGEQYLNHLIKELESLRNTLFKHSNKLQLIESIFVVDEAIDDSEHLLRKLAEEYDWINVITLSKNFGQHQATVAGILYSSGDWVITLDEDLQHKPEEIPRLLYKVSSESADVCYANTDLNTHNSLIKDFIAKTFKKIMSRILKITYVKNFNSFRAIRGPIARATAAICRHETYFDIALSWFTKRVCTVKVELIDVRNQANQGSGYNFWGLIKHAKRMFMSSKIKMLRIFIPLGISAFLFSLFMSGYALISALMNISTVYNKGWASTFLVVLFFGGLTVLLISMLLESLGDVLLNQNGKPTYFVVDRSNDHLLKKAIEQLGHVYSD